MLTFATKLIEAFNAANGIDQKNELTDNEAVWHELVLNGIGGKTVAEAKRNLTYQEACDWFLFAQQRGGISHTDRLAGDHRHANQPSCRWRGGNRRLPADAENPEDR